jgi:hypothetical protein
MIPYHFSRQAALASILVLVLANNQKDDSSLDRIGRDAAPGPETKEP